jgi:hypothetical protein
LIINNICTTNASKTGFKVNENFEADNNFFNVGHYLPGIVTKDDDLA